jgi:hypothetical protein
MVEARLKTLVVTGEDPKRARRDALGSGVIVERMPVEIPERICPDAGLSDQASGTSRSSTSFDALFRLTKPSRTLRGL